MATSKKKKLTTKMKAWGQKIRRLFTRKQAKKHGDPDSLADPESAIDSTRGRHGENRNSTRIEEFLRSMPPQEGGATTENINRRPFVAFVLPDRQLVPGDPRTGNPRSSPESNRLNDITDRPSDGALGNAGLGLQVAVDRGSPLPPQLPHTHRWVPMKTSVPNQISNNVINRRLYRTNLKRKFKRSKKRNVSSLNNYGPFLAAASAVTESLLFVLAVRTVISSHALTKATIPFQTALSLCHQNIPSLQRETERQATKSNKPTRKAQVRIICTVVSAGSKLGFKKRSLIRVFKKLGRFLKSLIRSVLSARQRSRGGSKLKENSKPKVQAYTYKDLRAGIECRYSVVGNLEELKANQQVGIQFRYAKSDDVDAVAAEHESFVNHQSESTADDIDSCDQSRPDMPQPMAADIAPELQPEFALLVGMYNDLGSDFVSPPGSVDGDPYDADIASDIQSEFALLVGMYNDRGSGFVSPPGSVDGDPYDADSDTDDEDSIYVGDRAPYAEVQAPVALQELDVNVYCF
ncbi:hypothetical protein FN846DRAFT_1019566 [Sphaerosporella brunnea]|uniref:Uncharacterized protein n=1 Tax=Sphaerosporella brunnea TaxID=1250544 RepID=A0A5J5F4W7_9PEZI|nr:hypothetical protein FN846DRAFT_1019566 [Sphaerosporella brunnea]